MIRAVFCFLLSLALVAAAGAAMAETELRLAVTEAADGGEVPSGCTAIVRVYDDISLTPDIWLPASFIDRLRLPMRYDDGSKSFAVRVGSPSGDIEIRLAALIDDEIPHLNVSDIEEITGISYILKIDRADLASSTLVAGPARLIRKERRKLVSAPAPLPSAPIRMIWDHFISVKAPDLSQKKHLSTFSVISPTWFYLGEGGVVTSRGCVSYSRSAKRAYGLAVWGMISNSADKAKTSRFLADASAQERSIAGMMLLASVYELDGINIDFEAIASEDRDRYSAFVRRLADAARRKGLAVSIDINVPAKWQKCFDRPALADAVDIVALMAYDEHWRTSPKAGSTASLPWTRTKLQETLADIPPDKLLLGIPLYTRLWEESINTDGSVSVKCITLPMADQEKAAARGGAEKIWLEDAGQHYFEYTKGGKRSRAWLEDERSLALRLELAEKHGLAGIAFWRSGFEDPSIWETFGAKLKR